MQHPDLTRVISNKYDISKPPIQRVSGFFPQGQSSRSVTVITHLHVISKLGMPGALSPHTTRIHGVIVIKHSDSVERSL
jgi:hypothetical protein